MPFISAFDPATLKSILRVSNYWGKANRNQYPLAFSKVLYELYEWVPCPCDDQCLCKKFNCTHHYIRKSDISFDLVKTHFLSCYVDKKIHNDVSLGTKKGRGEKAYEAITIFRDRWERFTPLTTNLLCNNWYNEEFRMFAMSFKPDINTIYKAKWLSLLQLDTFVAYDTRSVHLLIREYRGQTYFDLVSAIRDDLMKHLSIHSTLILSFRKYDNPQEFFSAIPATQYRPIGNIIDKLFLTL